MADTSNAGPPTTGCPNWQAKGHKCELNVAKPLLLRVAATALGVLCAIEVPASKVWAQMNSATPPVPLIFGLPFSGVVLGLIVVLTLVWLIGHEKDTFSAFISGVGIPSLAITIMGTFSL
jgi:hypothetical protein